MKYARWAGYLAQGLVLGICLAIALVNMAAVAAGVQIFRYQGF